jgi:GT2 family glycosyltransferase
MSRHSRNDARVTVAVVSWNTRELLCDCLRSLQDDVHSGLAEVWVVDNASVDGSADEVRRRFPWVSLIASRENLGFGRAVNLIAAHSTAPWLAPANADTRLTPGALERLILEGERHPEAAVVAPRLILPDGSTQHSAYTFPTVFFALAYTVGAHRVSRRLAERWCVEDGFDPDGRRDIPWAVGAFLLVRRSAWDEIGGFDNAQWMYAEDLDLGWRLRRAGWTARFEPDARVHHSESAATTQAWGDERFAQWHASSYAWLLRRRGAAVTRLIAAVYVAGFLARAAMWTPLTLAGSRRARDARRRSLHAAHLHAIGLGSRTRLEGVR